MLKPFFPELVMSTDLLSFEHPSVLLFCFLYNSYRKSLFRGSLNWCLGPPRKHDKWYPTKIKQLIAYKFTFIADISTMLSCKCSMFHCCQCMGRLALTDTWPQQRQDPTHRTSSPTDSSHAHWKTLDFANIIIQGFMVANKLSKRYKGRPKTE